MQSIHQILQELYRNETHTDHLPRSGEALDFDGTVLRMIVCLSPLNYVVGIGIEHVIPIGHIGHSCRFHL